MKRKILFVEDDQLDRTAIDRFLVEVKFPHGYDFATSVMDAKEQLTFQKYDAVVVDFDLGDGTCFEIFNSLDDTPFIVVTGGGSEDIAVEAIKCGASDYLVKDVEKRYLTLLPSVINSTIKTYQTEQTLNMLIAAMGSIPDGVYVTDVNANIIYVNQAFLTAYGYTEEAILGRSGKLLWDNNAHDNGGLLAADVYHKKKDGTVFPILLSRSAIKNSKGDKVHLINVVHDITDRKKMEQALADAIGKYSQLLERAEAKQHPQGAAQ